MALNSFYYFIRIDIATDIDWNEQQVLLKAAFPVDVHAKTAAYDIQYGTIRITLIKSGTSPNLKGDMGKRHFVYSQSPVELTFAENLESAVECNLMEDGASSVKQNGNKLKLTVQQVTERGNTAKDSFSQNVVPKLIEYVLQNKGL
jgi:hypothetical protein